MKAMILAAGRGERMRPLTDTCPKPLLPVAGTPLLFWHLQKLAHIGVQDVVINTAWLGESLVNAIGSGEAWGLNVHWSHEPPGGLETAGGIIQALPQLDSEPFIVVNGDIWTDLDFAQLPLTLEGALGHLVLVTNPPHNPQGDFALSAKGRIQRDGNKHTFSGVSVLSPELFKGLAPGYRALRPIFEQAIEENKLTGCHYSGKWTDVGTPERLAELEQALEGIV